MGLPVMDQRLLAIQGDPQQIKSVNDFIGSLIRELNTAEGTPPKNLMRELLAESLSRALELGGADSKQRFLEAVAANIHKFPLQEQQSLSRVHHVEISSEYQNLQSFVEDPTADPQQPPGAPTEAPLAALPAPGDVGTGSGAGSAGACPALDELRRSLAALPPRPGAAAEELAPRLREVANPAPFPSTAAAKAGRAGYFGDLRLNLFKLPEALQRELVERFQELRQEIGRLVVSMTQEISRWLDEEKVAAQRGSLTPLLAKLRALLQAVLSAPFSSTFKHLGSAEKKLKETFLLKIALCLRTCQERNFTEAADISEQVGQLRSQFFYVEGYGELMEDWLKNRIRQFNEEEFPQRVSAVLGTSMSSVLTRLQRIFRPGRWVSLSDVQLEEDIFALFLDDAFPRHVLTPATMAKLLQRVASFGGIEFHIYGSIARTPPLAPPLAGQPRDPTEAALLDVLQRFPPFPPLTRMGTGIYLFGRVQVEFLLRGAQLFARSSSLDTGMVHEVLASDFFAQYGPLEFPDTVANVLRVPDQEQTGVPRIVDAGPALDVFAGGPGAVLSGKGAGALTSPLAYNLPAYPSLSQPILAGAGAGVLPVFTGPQAALPALATDLAPTSSAFGLGPMAPGPLPFTSPAATTVPWHLNPPQETPRFEPYPTSPGSSLSLGVNVGASRLGAPPLLGTSLPTSLPLPTTFPAATDALASSKFGLDDDEL